MLHKEVFIPKLFNTIVCCSLINFDCLQSNTEDFDCMSLSCHICSASDCKGNRTHNHLVRKRTLNHLAKLTIWLRWIASTYCTVHLTVCSYHVTYAFCIFFKLQMVVLLYHRDQRVFKTFYYFNNKMLYVFCLRVFN